MSRELLQRALDLLCERDPFEYDNETQELESNIRAELEKPEPIACGVTEITRGGYGPLCLPLGKYKLLAVRIDDDN